MNEESKLQRSIIKAVKILSKGGIVIFPTDTVYGIGCAVNNKKAISRIYKIKKTSLKQNFPILINSFKQLSDLVTPSKEVSKLINKYWPGALTIIIKNKKNNKVGLRMPNSKLISQIIESLNQPIIGTSANIHGDWTPTDYSQLNPKLLNQVDYVIKGDCSVKKESTVIDTTIKPFKILRKGAVNVS